MTRWHCCFILWLTVSTSTTTAFLNQFPKPVQGLTELAQDQVGKEIKVTFRIGPPKANDVAKPSLYFQGCHLHLGEKQALPQKSLSSTSSTTITTTGSTPSSSKRRVHWPGAHVLHSKVSGGSYNLQVLQHPWFVGMKGQEFVEMDSEACWELVWKEGFASGSLICGFYLPRDYQRTPTHHTQKSSSSSSSATAPSVSVTKGPLYVSFPVWTPEGLSEWQERKRDVLSRAEACLEERDAHLQKMQETSNWLLKAWHYRNAAEAVERYSLTGYHWFTHHNIPDHMNKVVEMGGGLYMNTQGTVWLPNKKHASPLEALLPMQSIIVGQATATAVPAAVQPEAKVSTKNPQLSM
jgi:hypothetical protein